MDNNTAVVLITFGFMAFVAFMCWLRPNTLGDESEEIA